MKDLYKLAGLKRFEDAPGTIKTAASACASAKDCELVTAILCDTEKKQAYDQALETAALIENLERQIAGNTRSPGAEPEPGEPSLAGRVAPAMNLSSRRLLAVYGVVFGLLFMMAGWLSLKQDEQADTASSDGPSVEVSGEVAIVDIIRKRYHVTAETLNVRSGPGTRNPVVGQLKQYDDVAVEFPEARDGWARISTETGIDGYVSLDFVAPGNGSVAFRDYCLQSVTRPPTGRLVQSGSGGYQRLKVEAPPKHDISVRLENSGGDTALLGYVRAGQTYSFDDIPAGHYQMGVSAGKAFSVECGLFTDAMKNAGFTRALVFEPAISQSPDAHYQVTVSLKSEADTEI